MTITELSIKRPSLVIVVFSALVLLGIYSYTQLNYELLPKITPPVITITTVYPGASPNEVETSVTKPIEDAVSTLDQIDNISSTSRRRNFICYYPAAAVGECGQLAGERSKENKPDNKYAAYRDQDAGAFQICS